MKQCLLIVLGCMLAACSFPDELKNIVGTYRTNSRFSIETLTLNNDGTYVQEVELKKDGSRLKTSGSWSFEKGTIAFHSNFLLAITGTREANPDAHVPCVGRVSYPLFNILGQTFIGDEEYIQYIRE